jgi:hypothetical protein
VTESNLARSLFSNQKGQTPRRKSVQLPKELASISMINSHVADSHAIASEISAEISAESDRALDQTLDQAMEAALEAAQSDALEELETLRQDAVILRHRAAQLEIQLETKFAYAEQLEAKIHRLNETHSATIDTLKAQLAEAEAIAIESLHSGTSNPDHKTAQSQLLIELEQAKLALSESNAAIHELQTELAESHTQRENLEGQVVKYLSVQARMQQSLQEHNSAQDRLQDLEHQIAELQEQVLKQAGQSAEYEAAIQHWKDQSLHHQRHAVQLSGALERLLEERDVKRSKPESVRAEELALSAVKEKKVAAVPNSSNGKSSTKTIDLPSFLLRQR